MDYKNPSPIVSHVSICYTTTKPLLPMKRFTVLHLPVAPFANMD